MPIRLALVNDYEVVVRGLAEMLRSYTDAFDIVELDADMPVEQVVDIALYDTFAQAQGDGEGVARLLANPGSTSWSSTRGTCRRASPSRPCSGG